MQMQDNNLQQDGQWQQPPQAKGPVTKPVRPFGIFRKTLAFIWIKFGLWMLSLIVAASIGAACFAIGFAIGTETALIIMFIIWLILVSISHFLITRYLTFMVRAAHIAVVAQAVDGQEIPKNYVKHGTAKVKERFLAMNVFFIVNALLTRAVNQIARLLQRGTNAVTGNIPGLSIIGTLINLFIKILLGSVSAACMAWTFQNPQTGAFQTTRDGVVIYFKNWKQMMKSAALTAVIVIAIQLAVLVIMALIFNAIVGDAEYIGIWLAIGIVSSFLFAWAIKQSFLDSWIMVKMVATFMQIAPQTQIQQGDATRYQNCRSFRQLEERSQLERQQGTAAAGQQSVGWW